MFKFQKPVEDIEVVHAELILEGNPSLSDLDRKTIFIRVAGDKEHIKTRLLNAGFTITHHSADYNRSFNEFKENQEQMIVALDVDSECYEIFSTLEGNLGIDDIVEQVHQIKVLPFVKDIQNNTIKSWAKNNLKPSTIGDYQECEQKIGEQALKHWDKLVVWFNTLGSDFDPENRTVLKMYNLFVNCNIALLKDKYGSSNISNSTIRDVLKEESLNLERAQAILSIPNGLASWIQTSFEPSNPRYKCIFNVENNFFEIKFSGIADKESTEYSVSWRNINKIEKGSGLFAGIKEALQTQLIAFMQTQSSACSISIGGGDPKRSKFYVEECSKWAPEGWSACTRWNEHRNSKGELTTGSVTFTKDASLTMNFKV